MTVSWMGFDYSIDNNMLAEHPHCYTADSDGYDICPDQNIHELCMLHIEPSPQHPPS